MESYIKLHLESMPAFYVIKEALSHRALLIPLTMAKLTWDKEMKRKLNALTSKMILIKRVKYKIVYTKIT